MGKTKAKKCPSCGSTNISEYLYGLVILDPEKDMDKYKNIVFGGCCIKSDSPKYHCRDCENDWGIYFKERKTKN